MGCLTAKASGEIASFINPTVTPIESARVYFSPTQLGSGTPSPDNVREIVGRTGVELYQCGKNLFQNADGTKCPLQLKKGTAITISQSADVNTGYFRGYDENNNAVGSLVWLNEGTVNGRKYRNYTLEADIYYAIIYVDTGMKDAQVTVDGSIDFKPYQGITIPFSWKRLPNEYQEVEYIESNGNGEYIDTGFIGNMGVCVETKFNLLSANGNPAIIGSRIGSNNRFSFPVYYHGFDLAIGGDGDDSIGTWNLQEIYMASIVTNNNGSRMDIYGDNDYHVYKTVSSKVNNNLPLYIFRYNRDGNPDTINSSALRLYYLKIYDGDISDNLMVRYFIPCYRKSDNEIGMYDTVSQTFYTNQGTGTFTKGNDVFSDEVYGGYVDLVNGEIVDEWGIADLGQLSWSYGSLYQRFQSSSIGRLVKRGSSARKVDMYCSGFLCLSDGRSIRNVSDLSIYEGGNGVIYVHDSTYTNQNDFVLAVDGIILVYPLATPITHPLPDYLKVQLQTLKNENTFWSDADSVEIDYSLAETFDIQKAKRKIIMNQPHVESLSGDAVSFTTDMKAPLKECKVSFMPVQEGSGDPSPSNVRNITGWNGVNVNSGSNVYSVDWTDDVGTVYGGYVDLVSGQLVQTKTMITIDENSRILANSSRGVYYPLPDECKTKVSPIVDILSEIGTGPGDRLQPMQCCINSVGANFLFKIYEDDQSTTTAKTFLQSNPLHVVFELVEPIIYQLTPQQILSFKGINNFNCGIKNDMNVKYWKHKLSDSTNIAYEAENLTFDGTNYIDTGVYLFSEENINRDFEVVIEDLYGNGGAGNMTIVCAKYDSTVVGFLIRLNSSKNTTYNGTIFMKPYNHNNITIKRVNGVITIDGEVITNPTVKFTNTIHNHPLVLGCALQDDGTPYRYATGTIGHITVKWL